MTPNNPVWINRLDGHMALANTAAMQAAKVGDDVKDVAGGEIVRDNAGRPTGVFKDNAMSLIDRAQPDPTLAAASSTRPWPRWISWRPAA